MRSSRITRAFLLGCCFLVSVVSSAAAAPGDVDRSFGQEGVTAIQNEPPAFVTPEDMIVGPSGEVYVLRFAFDCSTPNCSGVHLVTRYLPGGLLDSSFGTAGTSRVLGSTEGGQLSRNSSLTLTPDGGIVVGSTDHGDVVLARLNPDGSTDAGFGTGGVASSHLSTPIGQVRIVAQGDGKIVVAGEPDVGYAGDAVTVTRYTAQGAPDPTFHGGTPLVTSLGSGFGGIALTRAGELLLSGPRCCGADGRAVHLARLTDSGVFDTAFGRQGESFVDDVADGVGVGALIALPGGGIYVVGSSRPDGSAFAVRLTSKGRLDHKYGHGGIAYIRHSSLEVDGAVVDKVGRLMVVGIAPAGSPRGSTSGPRRIALLRLLPNGARDRTFAGGSLIHLRSLGASQVTAAGLQNGRKLVVLASSGECVRTCPSPNSVLVRFLGGTSASRCQGKRATIVGTRHGEKLVGTPGRDVIAALAGNDLVQGRGGADLICGGRGDDRLVGGKGRDVLSGGAGSNRLHQ